MAGEITKKKDWYEAFLDSIKNKNCKILISNILDYKGKENTYLKNWIISNRASVKEITIRAERRF